MKYSFEVTAVSCSVEPFSPPSVSSC